MRGWNLCLEMHKAQNEYSKALAAGDKAGADAAWARLRAAALSVAPNNPEFARKVARHYGASK